MRTSADQVFIRAAGDFKVNDLCVGQGGLPSLFNANRISGLLVAESATTSVPRARLRGADPGHLPRGHSIQRIDQA